MRGRLAIALVLTLIVVMGLTFWYLLTLSRNFGELTTDDLIALIPMVGTVLLTPLVGLIGAVMGFYYGGQTAVQAASQTADATKAAAETTQNTAVRAAAAQVQEGNSGRRQNRPTT
jgi:type II secretory pathway component PulF